MKIIIAGAGEVGLHLSKLLSFESHDITLIDNNDVNLKDGENYLDIKVINGDSSSISTPFIFILSLYLRICGEVKVPTRYFFLLSTDSKKETVEPLPLVPATVIILFAIFDILSFLYTLKILSSLKSIFNG